MSSKERVKQRDSGSSIVFTGWLGLSVGAYVLLILLLVIADVCFVVSEFKKDDGILRVLLAPEFRDSVILTLVSCTVSAILSVTIAIPVGYALSRFRFLGRSIIDAIIDIPVVLPPLVIGLSLLILMNQFPSLPFFESVEGAFNNIGLQITNTKFAVVIAQFTVSAAFAIRTMKVAFDQLDSRVEDVAMTLGASRGRAFFDVVLPQTYRGVFTAGILAWARALGEFGPVLVFAGATRGKTEVLATSVYLEINTGNIGGAVIISLMMIIIAIAIILVVRILAEKGGVDA